MTEQEKKEYFDGLKEAVGTTEIWTAAGFILPDGSLLDLADENVYPDITCCAYTHGDLEKFFGYKQEDIMKYGGVRIGYSDTTDNPYIQVDLSENIPTDTQWSKLNDLLNVSPYLIDVQMNYTSEDATSFYKRYTKENNTITDLKRDMNNYLNGDTSNLGFFSEKLGEQIFIDQQ